MFSCTAFTERVPQKGLIDGHVLFNILSAEEEDVALAGICANIAGSILFEKLKAKGTNLIMQLTSTGGRIDVVARYEDDGISMLWPSRQAAEEELDGMLSHLREKTLAWEQPQEEKAAPDEKEDDEDLLVKHLTRIP